MGYPRNFLTVKYVNISIQCLNERVRNLRYSGLHENLVCTLCENKSPTIKEIDIPGSYEVFGNVRIVWSSKWSHYKSIIKK